MFRPKKEQEPGGSTPGPAARPGAFLGTLRSEFDEPEALPRGFNQLQENVAALLEAYEDGRLTKRELAERLARQRAVDHDGGEWTVGATTRSWYRRQGPLDMWMQVPAPSQAIGEPRPGAWQSPLDIPEAAPEPEPQPEAPSVAAPVQPVEETQETLDRKMEFPAEYIPGGAPGHSTLGPVSYDENFDASLAALLSEGHNEDAAPSAPTEEMGPAPRAGSGTFEQLGFGTGAYLGETSDEPGSYLGDEDTGLKNDYLDAAPPPAPTNSYGDFLDIYDEEQADPHPDEDVNGNAATPVEESAPPAPEPDELYLPDDFFWDDDDRS